MPYMVLEQYMFTCDFGFLYVTVSVSFRKTAVESLDDRTVFQEEFFSEASKFSQSCITIVGAMTFLTDKMTAALIVCEGPVIPMLAEADLGMFSMLGRTGAPQEDLLLP